MIAGALLAACGLSIVGAGEGSEDDGGPTASGEGGAVANGDGSSSAEVTTAPGSDGATSTADAAADADAGIDADADADAPPTCPTTTCTGGCSGRTCIIRPQGNGTGATTPPITCPADFDCWIDSQGFHNYWGPITCAPGRKCTIVCNGDQACKHNPVAQNGAQAVCFVCADGGCKDLYCENVTACTGACSNACDDGHACGACTPTAACP